MGLYSGLSEDTLLQDECQLFHVIEFFATILEYYNGVGEMMFKLMPDLQPQDFYRLEMVIFH